MSPDIQNLRVSHLFFFNFNCSLYICLDVKDTRVIGLKTKGILNTKAKEIAYEGLTIFHSN